MSSIRIAAPGRAKSIAKICLVLLPCIIMVLLAVPSNPAQHNVNAATGELLLCSVNSTGDEANGYCAYPSVTPDGRYLVFQSNATNLVAGDTNAKGDIFRKDLTTGEVICCSITASSEFGNDESTNSSISPDGRYVVFKSKSNNLVAGDTNAKGDIFRKDLTTGEVICCSTTASSEFGNGESSYSSISSDGRYVAFSSNSTNLVSGDTNAVSDIFRKDLMTGEVACCSITASSVWGNRESSYQTSIDATGNLVFFQSYATNFIPDDNISSYDIFRKNLMTGELICCSRNTNGTRISGSSEKPVASPDGRYVVFLTSGGWNDIYRKDLVTDQLAECSYDESGKYSYAFTYFEKYSISNDGRFVAFGAHQGGVNTQIFRRDMDTGTVSCCSTSENDVMGDASSDWPSLTADGSYVFFHSSADNLIERSGSSTYVLRKHPINELPYINSIDSPSGCYGGSIIKISGSFFGVAQGDSYVSFGSERATSYSFWSETEIDVVVPMDLYDRTLVTVTNNVGVSNAYEKTVSPHIDSVDPDHAGIGSMLTIHGSGFWNEQGNSYIHITCASGNHELREVDSWSNNAIEFHLPYGSYRGAAINVSVIVRGTWPLGKEITFDTVGMGFAEGYTGQGFQEFLCIGNSSSYPADVIIYYLLPDQYYLDQKVTVPANSRTTVNVNAEVPDMEVSTYVDSDIEVVVERPMYFNYGGAWTGGHDAVASRFMGKDWYFAEGYTGPGFDEWLCILNLDDADANLTFHFQTQEEGEIIRNAIVPVGSRGSFKINDLLGPNYQCSLWLESDQFVIAERSLYFDYMGMNNGHWEGGHCVMGVTYLSQEYYFAEGTTRTGFEEWLTIQNPHDHDINVSAVYQMQAGQGNPVNRQYSLPPGNRYTVFVPGEIGMEKDVSIKLTSDEAFLAERPMYFQYAGVWEGGHCVIGAMETSSDWFFAEGYTGPGFDEWLCLQNPGAKESTVEVTYLTQEAGALAPKTIKVGAGSRVTIPVNSHAGPGYQLSTRLRVISGPGIVAERPMYFDFGGWDGGHDVVGYVPMTLTSSAYQSAEASGPVPLARFDISGWKKK